MTAGGLAGHLAADWVTDPARLAVTARKLSPAARVLGQLSEAAASPGTDALKRYLLENAPKAGGDGAAEHFLAGN